MCMYGAGGKSVCLPLCVCVYVEGGGEEEQREKGGGGDFHHHRS